ncbi:MAG: 4-hydroxythreonine-4-phosphate dehydrogenase PdxA [Rhizobiales bacterium]|nr:4-hydroxythreonine-4-phosphate dehydrogenase PdxA [Hyphomicrobiales bacterium]MBA70081.1 4-hydroxythreonine-4-phosphate dehydrogenase PdxA [Hyphomicrobiales bacterium]
MTSENGARALALSMGDPAGIGPDIALMAWARRARTRIPAFFVVGDPAVLSERAGALGIDVSIEERTPESAASAFTNTLPVVPVRCPAAVRAGEADPANGGAVIEAIRMAVEYVSEGRAGAVVTAPIAKSVLYNAGFRFPGHTEYLAALASESTGADVRPVMLLANQHLRVAPVTIHIPLARVPGELTTQDIVETAQVLADGLTRRFGIPSPRLAISGLNPHAGENGAIGSEDEEIVRPAVSQLQAEGILAYGPLPADTMFHEEARAAYDAAICMYHDQALIPVKTLGFHDGVNITLGLPFIRTSPDHGTAFSLAGTGQARPDSLISALMMAAGMAAHEAAWPTSFP